MTGTHQGFDQKSEVKKGPFSVGYVSQMKMQKEAARKRGHGHVFFLLLFFLLLLLFEFTDAEMPRKCSKQFHSGPINMRNPSEIT